MVFHPNFIISMHFYVCILKTQTMAATVPFRCCYSKESKSKCTTCITYEMSRGLHCSKLVCIFICNNLITDLMIKLS